MTHAITSTTRRELLKKISALGLVHASAPLGISLLGMANAAAQTATDYKAIVCLFMWGGSDHYNTVIPYDLATHKAYYGLRSSSGINIGIPRANLTGTVLNSMDGLPDGQQMALAPEMPGLKSVFDAGRASVLLNVGLLSQPTTKDDFFRKANFLPSELFSHSHNFLFQASKGRGWGGRMADLVLAENGANISSLFTSTSLYGGVFPVGDKVRPYRINTKGPVPLTPLANSRFGPAFSQAMRNVIRKPSLHLMEEEYADTMRVAMDVQETVTNAIGNVSPAKFDAWFPGAGGGNLTEQMKMVARLVEQGPALGLKRQVFMVGIGGFDTHDGQSTRLPELLTEVSGAMTKLDTALKAMNIADRVTTFTASEFGRTLTSNGDGTDHGWGSHHFLMGGALNGGRFIGQLPPMGLRHNWDLGRGRLLPTTSVTQLSAELARWFGVSDSDFPTVFPNSGTFDLYKLGIFKANA